MIDSSKATGTAGTPLLAAWEQVGREWQANVRLRWGIRLIAATLWLWLLLVAHDQAKTWRAAAEETRVELQRLQILRSETHWPKRAEEARTQLEGARALLWSAASRGQAEAALQDALREMCSKAGLPVRELAIAAADAKPGSDGVTPLRARLVVDMGNRLALTGLLAEIGRSPQVMMVDSLRLRPQLVPARVELEVRVLFRPQERVAGT